MSWSIISSLTACQSILSQDHHSALNLNLSIALLLHSHALSCSSSISASQMLLLHHVLSQHHAVLALSCADDKAMIMLVLSHELECESIFTEWRTMDTYINRGVFFNHHGAHSGSPQLWNQLANKENLNWLSSRLYTSLGDVAAVLQGGMREELVCICSWGNSK